MTARLKNATEKGAETMENSDIISMELALPLLSPKIMVVDDDEAILKLVSLVITRKGYVCDTSNSIEAARLRLENTQYDILFLDLMLPDGSGMNILEERTNFKPHTVVVIITGEQELETAVQVIRGGAYDFISKPFKLAVLEERLDKVIGEWRSRVRYQYYNNHLEDLVNAMTEKLLKTSKQIEQIYDTTVAALGAALDLRDPETEEHCYRVSRNSICLGKALGLSATELRNLKRGAYLHDIGKIGIPEHILMKPTKLTAEEMEVVKAHPLLGYRMVSGIEFLKVATDVVLYHHEKYDGSGYPNGLKGKDIPTAARIFAVIDTLDAMVYDRPYRKALPLSEFVRELKKESGKQFDPDVVEKFLEIPENAWQVEEDNKKVKLEKRIVDARETLKKVRR